MLNLPSRVLIIDDDSDLREALAEEMTQAGLEPIKAEDGLDGLEKARQEQPDLILLDIAMPNLDGIEVLRALRDDGSTKKTPVVILTNINEMDLVKRIPVELKAEDYIVKSDTTLANIVDQLKEKLNGSR